MVGLREGASEPLSSVGLGGCDISSGLVNVFGWARVRWGGSTAVELSSEETVLLMALMEEGRTIVHSRRGGGVAQDGRAFI